MMNLNRRGFLKFLGSIPILSIWIPSIAKSKYLVSNATTHGITVPTSVTLISIPVGPSGVTPRIIYRSTTSDGVYKEIGRLYGNESTFTDTDKD